jgi:hypothetical protein
MRLSHHISDQQEKFLRDVRDSALILGEIQQRSGLTDARLARWMRNAFFWEKLREALRETVRRRRVELELAANAASRMLSDATGRGAPLEVRLEELCERVVRVRRMSIRPRRGGAKKKPAVPLERDLCHPDFKHRERELLAIMEEEERRWNESEAARRAANTSVGGEARSGV